MKPDEMRRLRLRGRLNSTIRNPQSAIRLRQGYGGQVRNHNQMWLLVVALETAWFASAAFAGARVEGDWIVVSGKGNTLETVAREVGDKAILSFDPETGSATSARSLRIAGELLIGGARTSGTLSRFAGSLDFDVGQCGQARIVLAGSSDSPARLIVENARIATLRTDEGNDACKNEGNVIEAATGSFVLRHSEVSGNFLLRAGGGAVEIENSLIGTSNHTGASLSGASTARARMARLRSLDHKMYGMEIGPAEDVSGSSPTLLMLEECTIRGGGADLHVRGRTEAVARDCDFDSIRFAGEGGSVRRQWTVVVRTSAPGFRVVAESETGAARAERIEATADGSGTARLVLTEYTAQPGGLDYLQRGRNDSTPHRLTVYSADGKTIVGRLGHYRVFARGQEVRIP